MNNPQEEWTQHIIKISVKFGQARQNRAKMEKILNYRYSESELRNCTVLNDHKHKFWLPLTCNRIYSWITAGLCYQVTLLKLILTCKENKKNIDLDFLFFQVGGQWLSNPFGSTLHTGNRDDHTGSVSVYTSQLLWLTDRQTDRQTDRENHAWPVSVYMGQLFWQAGGQTDSQYSYLV